MAYSTEQARMMGFEATSVITPEMRKLHDQKLPAYRLSDKRVVKITRLRLAGCSGFLDVQYCYGKLADGTDVHVILPEHQFRYARRGGHALLRTQLVQMCKKAGRYGVGLGLFDFDVISILY